MGLDHSKPLSQYSSEDVAAFVEGLGRHYEDAAKSIRGGGVDGAFLASLNSTELQETLGDLGVENRLHRRVLEKKLYVGVAGEAVEQQGNSSTGRSRVTRSQTASSSRAASSSPVRVHRSNTTSCTSRGSRPLRRQKTMEEKEADTKKLTEMMKELSEEHFGLLLREKELRKQIQLSSTGQAA